MAEIENKSWLRRTCKSAGEHIEFVHQNNVDRCLCGGKKRRCKGDCGLTDLTWLGPGVAYGNATMADTYKH
jgi:hypothetical protein